MSFKLENFGSEASNAKSIFGGINWYKYTIPKGDNWEKIQTAGYFPVNLGLKEFDRILVVDLENEPNMGAVEFYVIFNYKKEITIIPCNGSTLLVSSDLNQITEKLNMLPDEPEEDGKYYLTCTKQDGEVSYEWTPAELLPVSPDTDGEYVLMRTVADEGTVVEDSWTEKNF